MGNLPWGSSLYEGTWGGYLKVRPTNWSYAQAGLYLMPPPETTNTDLDNRNTKLFFPGLIEPGGYKDGYLFLYETGITPVLGPSLLPGKYTFGGWYFGVADNAYYSIPNLQRFGFYWQAAQMIWRKPLAALPPVSYWADYNRFSPSGKTPSVYDQGIYLFSCFDFAPPSNDFYPFYFQTGIVFKGLIPTRELDQFGAAFALGTYSGETSITGVGAEGTSNVLLTSNQYNTLQNRLNSAGQSATEEANAVAPFFKPVGA